MLPGVGTSAVLRVELGRPLAPEKIPGLVEQLLKLKYVERVDAAGLQERDDESAADAGGDRDEAPAVLNFDDPLRLHDLDETDRDEGSPAPSSKPVPIGTLGTNRRSRPGTSASTLRSVPPTARSMEPARDPP